MPQEENRAEKMRRKRDFVDTFNDVSQQDFKDEGCDDALLWRFVNNNDHCCIDEIGFIEDHVQNCSRCQVRLNELRAEFNGPSTH